MSRLALTQTLSFFIDVDTEKLSQVAGLGDCVLGLQVITQLLDQVLMRRSYGKVIYMNAKVDAFTLGSNLEE